MAQKSSSKNTVYACVGIFMIWLMAVIYVNRFSLGLVNEKFELISINENIVVVIHHTRAGDKTITYISR